MIKEFKHLLKDGVVVTFLTFATFVGILDSLIIFFLLWYLLYCFCIKQFLTPSH
jgi:hypothetical protein